MRVDTGGFSVDFTDAVDAFVFDETDPNSTHFHGAPMKAVDIVAEFPDRYVFVEIKDPHDPALYDTATTAEPAEAREKRDRFVWLKEYLKYKYRDSYLYRHAEDRVDKPIFYFCLLMFENPLNMALQKSLRQELPAGRSSERWQRSLVQNCHVLNLEKWNQVFPKWPARRI
jgi:hypothetical protein